MNKTIGFIGSGNIGGAIIGGVIKAGLVTPKQIIAADVNENRLASLSKDFQINTTLSNVEAAMQSDILFLSVKPFLYDPVIAEIKTFVKPDAIIVVVAAGYGIGDIKKMFGIENIKIAKAMPNIPAMVNAAMTAVCTTDTMTESEIDSVLAIFNSVGQTEILPEHLFDVFTAVAGSSPAYAFIFIDALADAGVKYGLTRPQALKFCTQVILGVAKMIQETGEHPAALKDTVCTPGGTTIEAICELDKLGFRNAIISCVDACVEKSKRIRG
ncbi:MAG: pyrroline-5-carboxylate reductase [Defluviitaleaceae bacterium]|nr:pyrroline-5-carboxylate reductase [Defluviitaleaceae bacterium]